MAEVRVFLLTCRRPKLLPRALASLRAQTFTDWVCELHNDAPEDNAPRQLVDSLNDSRITLCQHERNWGPIAVFNHAFAGGPEPFATLLEDDNWWDSAFLATTLAALRATPAANVAWSNMTLWQEEPDGSWRNTGRTIWDVPLDHPPRLFYWPELLQCSDALHSNGSMLFRARASASALVPPSTPFAIIEPVRERLLPGGWLFIPRPLAHFARTLSSARSDDRTDWVQAQLLVAASFLDAVPTPPLVLSSLWEKLRNQTPSSTSLLFQLAFSDVNPRQLLRHATLSDWCNFLAGAIRHPLVLIRARRFRRDYRELWTILITATRQRTAEAIARSGTEKLPGQLQAKILR